MSRFGPNLGYLGPTYSGYAFLGGIPLKVHTGSSVAVEGGLQPSQGSWSRLQAKSTGQRHSRNRKSLVCSLRCDLSPESCLLIPEIAWRWRAAESHAAAFALRLSLASGRGYQTEEAFVDTVGIQVPESGGCTVSFDARSWVWESVDAPDSERIVAAFDPGDSSRKPIPHWTACLVSDALPGAVRSWSASFRQQFSFLPSLEATEEPPEPKYVSAGSLEASIQAVLLANRSAEPAEVGDFLLDIREPSGAIQALRVRIPGMVRSSGWQWGGFADPVGAAGVSVSYLAASGDLPIEEP
jgi:hypothetical protein